MKTKRKLQSDIPNAGPSSALSTLPVDALPWKTIKTTSFSGLDAGGGMMMLEELDDVAVEWVQDEGGAKKARFIPAPNSKGKGKAKETKNGKRIAEASNQGIDGEDEDETINEDQEITGDDEIPSFSRVEEEDMNEVDQEDHLGDEAFDDTLLPQWSSIPLHPILKRSLSKLGFTKPTDIQARALPVCLAGRDVVGVAETGSGKTLAYALPILSYLLRNPRATTSKRTLSSLILCPTRELALQVVDHLNTVIRQTFPEKKGPPRISVGSVIGGLSAQKQQRILDRGCDVLVATPGRLWDLIKANDDLAAEIKRIRFLVIDEADRMIENGHFAELESIVRLTERQSRLSGRGAAEEEDPVFAATSSLDDVSARSDMQTFIFSATLSKDLQQNFKRKKRGSQKGDKKSSALEDLVERLDFRDKNPEVIDLSPEGGVVAMLKESMIECVLSEKDLFLYYFLLRYPGRSLVFVGSIDGIRRLVPLFELLRVPVWPLHSQLQQKQRLKNLDRFKTSKNGILIATDVAARGLDIPHVDHVVHFNLPRTADAYIHRSGRTARAQNPGFALQLVSAEDKNVQRSLMRSLGRDIDIPDLPIEGGFLPKLKERIRVAREIEKAQHGVKKENHDRNWLREAAEAMDVDIDPSMLSDGDDPDAPFAKSQNIGRSGKVVELKEELNRLLAEPLIARGVSARYPTSGSKVIVGDLLSARGHPTLLGASSTSAYDEIQFAKKKKPKLSATGERRSKQIHR
ncbi:hypothetical protein TREMEDRAFT_65359 [Tremella mesenterica DSM 1558]|uniref:uncharacterized protein n=1 Tax=Tremella mesenterica (strain ATCC 24925 / CBS 8224 / DSM 1558 / NBRC 9311 / NRRL Y-6157 / RJB 2259-6 / UBC 559-6) TaxID=578456 RepID=UPI00032C96F0|nr:uncharacterized protein TREMEDRAFT_65359 [Tremella mesenterica DSM 1558]EIW66497.1 hypothetical protein TREMEDRAFT_65359 [Tremella mesenterica DSM 1558]